MLVSCTKPLVWYIMFHEDTSDVGVLITHSVKSNKDEWVLMVRHGRER